MAEQEQLADDLIIVEEPDVVDIGAIDSSQDEQEEKIVQKKKPVRKRGNDQQQRLNEIWLGRKEAEEEANRQARLAAAERAKNAQYEQITADALEESLNTKRDLLKERLVRAQESQDATRIAEIQVELGKVEAQSAQIDRYKIENKVRAQQEPEPVQVRTSQETTVSPDELYERMSPAGKRWLDENNDWYANDSENYDSEKSGDVKYYAQTLEQEMLRAGRGAEIGTKSYFNKINEYIKQNWGEDMRDQSDEDEAQASPPKKSYAAPVGNRSAQTPSPGARREYKISQSEKEMALALDMKDKSGNPLSDNEKIRRFISLRESTPADGPISMKTMKKGV